MRDITERFEGTKQLSKECHWVWCLSPFVSECGCPGSAVPPVLRSRGVGKVGKAQKNMEWLVFESSCRYVVAPTCRAILLGGRRSLKNAGLGTIRGKPPQTRAKRKYPWQTAPNPSEKQIPVANHSKIEREANSRGKPPQTLATSQYLWEIAPNPGEK